MLQAKQKNAGELNLLRVMTYWFQW